MGHVNSVIWIVPLAVHVGYFWATVFHMPPFLQVAADGGGTFRATFIIGWCAVIGAANSAFGLLIVLLPRLKDSMLQVPGKAYWLSSAKLKRELVTRLRSVCTAALFGLNIFFLAVYQSIYQSHLDTPYLRMSVPRLVVFFMVVPLLVSVISIGFTVRSLAVDARGEKNGE